MADAVKAQKLAAARRRLKEYQKTQSNKKVIKNDDQDNVDPSQTCQMGTSSENVTPAESMVSSTHSILDPSVAVQENMFQIQDLDVAAKSETQPTINSTVDNNSNANFFNKTLFQSNGNNHILSNYFDTVADSMNASNLVGNFTHNIATETLQTNVNEPDNKLLNLGENVDKNNQNTVFADPFEPPANQNQIFVPSSDYSTTQTMNATELSSFDTHARSSEMALENSEDMYSQKQITHERQKSECALQENIHEDTSANQKIIFSNTESLRQLSSQLNSLIDSDSVQNVGISDLERRNQELATMLKNEQLKTEQLNLQLREFMTRITQLETDSQQMKNEYDAKLSRETGPLQEQLQYHIQTVGILVGEKTELTMALNQSQTTAKQKTSECEELQGRLKASRHRVSELEKEVNLLKSTKENFDKNEQENNREFERLRLEYNLLKEQCQETSEESLELREKLNAKINECLSLQQEVQEKNSQLSLTQLKIQQLTTGENMHIESQLEALNQQKISLEQQIAELTQTVKTISTERDQASQQYQQYVQQLNGQIQNLAESLDTKNIENDNLSKREQSLIKHIGELEKHLQHLQNERQTFAPNKNDNENEMKILKDTLHSLQNEHSELEAKLSEELEKRNELDSEIKKKDDLILELETKIEQLTDQPDASKLLAAMESDKVAASRAVEQNKKLKEQLQELHDGFIKMSNSKLELTENLQAEQYQNKELSEKLAQSTTAVEHLHSVIAAKDKELMEIQNRETELQKQVLQQDQLADRLRHYEAQGNASDFVQQELQQVKHTVEKLTAANKMLTAKLNDLEQSNIESTSASQNIQEDVANLENANSVLTQHLPVSEKEEINSTDVITSERNLDKERAMQQLEERFKNTMLEVAELTGEKERLEHLVLQLQSETETIGEYVTLYQCQRAMLKEKTLEKDEQLKRLAQDREEMKVKLDELNALVQKLIIEKEILPKELLHHSLIKNRHDVCDTHKQDNKLQKKENDKNQDSIVNGNNHDNNNENFGTAGKIISLLSEIKTSNLVQPGDNIQNFHPCPWCSGQLITV